MKFKCVKDTVLNGQPRKVGEVIDSQVDIRQYGTDWVLCVEKDAPVEVPVPRITRIKK